MVVSSNGADVRQTQASFKECPICLSQLPRKSSRPGNVDAVCYSCTGFDALLMFSWFVAVYIHPQVSSMLQAIERL